LELELVEPPVEPPLEPFQPWLPDPLLPPERPEFDDPELQFGKLGGQAELLVVPDDVVRDPLGDPFAVAALACSIEPISASETTPASATTPTSALDRRGSLRLMYPALP
jgi:hypothetical protein